MFEWIIKNRIWVLVIFIGVTLVLAYFASLVKPDNSTESLGVRGDPAIEVLRNLEKKFGNEEFVSISFELDDVLSAKSLALIENISSEIEKIPYINQVVSLTRVPTIRSNQDEILTELLIKKEWVQTGVPEKERSQILNDVLSNRLVFSQDGKATAIFGQFEPLTLGNQDEIRDSILSQFEAITEKYFKETGVKFYITGLPVANRLRFRVVENEQVWTSGLMTVMIAFIFWILYRRIALVILPVIIMGAVMIWVMATIYLTGARFNFMLAIAPAVITIVSICNSVHVVNHYLDKKNLSPLKRIVFVIKKLALPCFFTVLTDLVGFFSISTSKINAVSDFGLYVGLGSIYACILTIFLLPVLLSFLKDSSQYQASEKYNRFAQRLLLRVLKFDLKYPKAILFAGGIALVVACVGMSRIKVEQRFLTTYKWGGESIQRANKVAQEKVGASAEFYAFFDSNEPNAFLNPDNLRALDKMHEDLTREIKQHVVKIVSLPLLVKSLNQAVHNQDPQYFKIPDTSNEVAQLLFLAESTNPEMIRSVASENYSETRLRLFCAMTDSSRELSSRVEVAHGIIKKYLPDGITYDLTGQGLVILNTMFYILDSQLMSMGTAFLVILISLTLLFRSLKIGLVCMVPNLLPILMAMGFIGWFGIELDVAVSMVASTVIGIAVDDTIHFIWKIKKMVEEGESYEAALAESFREAGFAAFSATFIVCSGFLVFVVSQVWPVTNFAVMTAFACFLCLIVELLLTPVVLILFKPIKVKKTSHDNSNYKTI